jgi:hypothetical protein
MTTTEYSGEGEAQRDLRQDQDRSYQDTETTRVEDANTGSGSGRHEAASDRSVAAVDDTEDEPMESLVSDPESLRRQWESVQVGFVDDPRRAVGDADVLVSSVIEDLAGGFRSQRERLEARWSEGSETSTDDLRESFRRYRDFFDRLLQV